MKFALLVVFLAFMIHVNSFRISFKPFHKNFCGRRINAKFTTSVRASAKGGSDVRISEPPSREEVMRLAAEHGMDELSKQQTANLKNAAVQQVDDMVMKKHLAVGHEIYKKYPFFKLELPILEDRDNYYSGSFKGKFWHQNADQVFLYMPVDEKLKTSEVDVHFEVNKVFIKIKDEDYLSLDFFDSIIPHGSFWMFERDQYGVKYLLLDLEKRFRMINWNGLLHGIVNPQETSNAVLMQHLLQSDQFANLQKQQPMVENEDIFKSDPNNGEENLHTVENGVALDPEEFENMEFENPEALLNPDGDVENMPTEAELVEAERLREKVVGEKLEGEQKNSLQDFIDATIAE